MNLKAWVRGNGLSPALGPSNRYLFHHILLVVDLRPPWPAPSIGSPPSRLIIRTTPSASSPTSSPPPFFVLLQEFAIKGVRTDAGLDSVLKTSYTSGKYSLVASLAQATGKLGLSAAYSDLAPGLKLTVSGTLPDPDSAKIGLDYSRPNITLKSASTLTSSPKVDISATTGFLVNGQDVVAGAETGYDTAKGAITGYKLGLGYTAADYQASVTVNDKNELTTLLAHNVSHDLTVGAEVVRSLSNAETALSAGVARRLPSGALQKVKVAHTGLVQVLHEQVLEGKSIVALSGQFDAKDLSKAPKYGIAVDFNY
jgi:hypothetical protein